jgi:cytochrome c
MIGCTCTSAATAALVVCVVFAASGSSRTEGRLKAAATYVASGFIRTVSAQSARSIKSGVYTIDQARRGRDHYRKRCVLCHLDNGQGRGADVEIAGQSLEREGDAEAPAVAGDPFLTKWSGKSAGSLYDLMRKTMPVGAAGTLSAQEYADVLAYMLELSKLPAGQQDLPSARDQLDLITIER